MLFTARSMPFSSPLAGSTVSSIARTRNVAAHLPWLVVTFLGVGESSSRWETVCAVREEELLDHLKRAGSIRIAQFLYMGPPKGAGETWARHEIHRLERVTSPQGELFVYVDNRERKHCFANADFDVDSSSVSMRETLVRVDRYVHFD
nr:hypothetical protein [Variovorax boronicumulans]